jgi:hypothetical protein
MNRLGVMLHTGRSDEGAEEEADGVTEPATARRVPLGSSKALPTTNYRA